MKRKLKSASTNPSPLWGEGLGWGVQERTNPPSAKTKGLLKQTQVFASSPQGGKSFKWLGFAFLITLAACDQIEWPHVWGPDEVPQTVRDEPRDVPAPPLVPDDTPYPLVGAVPSKPKTFTPQSTIDLTKEM